METNGLTYFELIIQLIEALIWPLIVLYIFAKYQKPIGNLLERAKKVELPGGISIEAFDKKIEAAKSLAKEVKKSIKPAVVLESYTEDGDENSTDEKIKKLGIRNSVSNLQSSYYKNLSKENPRLAVANMRMDLDMIVKNMAKASKIADANSKDCKSLNFELASKGNISDKQKRLIDQLIDITDIALSEVAISHQQANDIVDIMSIAIADYKQWMKEHL